MTAIYTCRDSSGRALYVGMSLNAARRLSEHTHKPWFGRVATVAVEPVTRSRALAVEAETIRVLDPVYNIVHGGEAGVCKLRALGYEQRLPAAGELHGLTVSVGGERCPLRALTATDVDCLAREVSRTRRLSGELIAFVAAQMRAAGIEMFGYGVTQSAVPS